MGNVLRVRAFKNARVYALDPVNGTYARSDGLIVKNGRIRSLSPQDAGAGVECVDFEGGTILPAFSDAHVHLTDTGLLLGPYNLSRTRSYGDFCDAVSRLPSDAFVMAGNYDESSWADERIADAAPLERYFADSFVMLVRVDGHSCIMNRKTVAWLGLPAQVEGIERDARGDPTGKLFLDANWQAQSKFMAALPQRLKRKAEHAATQLALSRGALHLHVQLVGFGHDEYSGEIAALQQLPPAKWYPKICEPDPSLAKSLQLPYVGGDVFLDGSIGSCTAAVREPYAISVQPSQPPGTGKLRYSDEEVYSYFHTAEEMGVSAGVHAIGDRAIEQCIATWEAVLKNEPSPRNRHFIEHFEIATQDQIERCARLGIMLSMQPAFDLLWGGSGNMYERRLGMQRMRSMNALGRALRAGATLCGGDDSPVCDLSPLQGMQACVEHHEPQERLTVPEALTMYTHNVAKLGHVEGTTGRLAEGLAADFVVLDKDPLDGARFGECTVLQTWRDGEKVFDLERDVYPSTDPPFDKLRVTTVPLQADSTTLS